MGEPFAAIAAFERFVSSVDANMFLKHGQLVSGALASPLVLNSQLNVYVADMIYVCS